MIPIIYTLLVKYIDVQEIGPNDSLVGFATINNFMFNLTGVNMLWYDIKMCIRDRLKYTRF